MPFGEIVANPSDLKHVVELLRCSDGLGVVITVSLHHLCVFYWRLHKCRSGVDRRLVCFFDGRRICSAFRGLLRASFPIVTAHENRAMN